MGVVMRDIDPVIVRRSREQSRRDREVLSELVEIRRSKEKSHGMTQKVIAERMGTYQANVSRLETGEVDVRRRTLRKYAIAIGASLTYRVTDHDSEAPASEEL